MNRYHLFANFGRPLTKKDIEDALNIQQYLVRKEDLIPYIKYNEDVRHHSTVQLSRELQSEDAGDELRPNLRSENSADAQSPKLDVSN